MGTQQVLALLSQVRALLLHPKINRSMTAEIIPFPLMTPQDAHDYIDADELARTIEEIMAWYESHDSNDAA